MWQQRHINLILTQLTELMSLKKRKKLTMKKVNLT